MTILFLVYYPRNSRNFPYSGHRKKDSGLERGLRESEFKRVTERERERERKERENRKKKRKKGETKTQFKVFLMNRMKSTTRAWICNFLVLSEARTTRYSVV
jgi:hypothetical protein